MRHIQRADGLRVRRFKPHAGKDAKTEKILGWSVPHGKRSGSPSRAVKSRGSAARVAEQKHSGAHRVFERLQPSDASGGKRRESKINAWHDDDVSRFKHRTHGVNRPGAEFLHVVLKSHVLLEPDLAAGFPILDRECIRLNSSPV